MRSRRSRWRAGLVLLLVYFVRNASQNMVKAGIASGFDFLWRQAGIDIPFQLTGYTSASSNLGLLWLGIVNTLLAAALGIVLATLLGFALGVARLARNPILSGLAGAYVEFARNIPLLFFVLIWYFGVVASFPGPAGLDRAVRRRVSQQSRADHSGAERDGRVWYRDHRPGPRDRRATRAGGVVAAAPSANRPPAAALDERRAAGRGPARARVRDRRGGHRLGRAGPARIQLSRRVRARAGAGGAGRRALHLHGGVRG